MQNRESSPSPMFSSATRLLFWYIVFLSEKVRLPAPVERKNYLMITYLLYFPPKCPRKFKTVVPFATDAQTQLPSCFYPVMPDVCARPINNLHMHSSLLPTPTHTFSLFPILTYTFLFSCLARSCCHKTTAHSFTIMLFLSFKTGPVSFLSIHKAIV